MIKKLLDRWFTKKWRHEYQMTVKQSADENMSQLKQSTLHSGLIGGNTLGGITLTKSKPDPSISFNVYPAHNGGFVVEYNAWDQPNACYEKRLHIIGSEQDLGQGISHIITVEMLRR